MYPTLKRIGDLALALGVVFVTAPFLLLLALVILIDDGLPVIFKQSRAGYRGDALTVYKFRTLKNDNDPLDPESHVIRSGRLLRRLGIDELPQVWNIIKGEMSFVGPRPILHAEANNYDDVQRRRLDVLPGITGWAQVNGRNRLGWEERIEKDLWYVDHASLALDVKILLRTPVTIFRKDGVYGPGNLDPSDADFDPNVTS